MAGERTSITIKTAMNHIEQRTYLLPALQRKYVWSMDKICALFDSLMQDYPINTLMLWEVKDPSVKENNQFYQFLTRYQERWDEDSKFIQTGPAYSDFYAVIDGQQRLTSIYLGLLGSYAIKNSGTKFRKGYSEDYMPPRTLHLDLLKELRNEEDADEKQDDINLKKYNFEFKTQRSIELEMGVDSPKHHWYKLADIYNLYQKPDQTEEQMILAELARVGLPRDEMSFAFKTLLKLYRVIFVDKVIHLYTEESQSISRVLDIFLRTNNGGQKLDFADLIMSIMISHWTGKKDFRSTMNELLYDLSSNYGFYLSKDWVLKACLMLLPKENVRFKVENFDKHKVQKIEEQWQQITDCIKATLTLVKRININDGSLRAKNALLPICYFLYLKRDDDAPVYTTIHKPAVEAKYRDSISQWLCMVLLKGTFGGHADSLLKNHKDIIAKVVDSSDDFPLDEFIIEFSGTPKDLQFREENLDYLMETEYGDHRCGPLLQLLFPQMRDDVVFEIDHLNPKAWFDAKRLDTYDFLKDNEQLKAFYRNGKYWNGLPNLGFLQEDANLDKSDTPLKDWLTKHRKLAAADLLVSEENLAFEKFKEFYTERKNALKELLRQRVRMV